jgi:hypothetical protein
MYSGSGALHSTYIYYHSFPNIMIISPTLSVVAQNVLKLLTLPKLTAGYLLGGMVFTSGEMSCLDPYRARTNISLSHSVDSGFHLHLCPGKPGQEGHAVVH